MEARVAVGRSRFLAVLLLFWAVLASTAVVVSSLTSLGMYCLFSLIFWLVGHGVYRYALLLDGRSMTVLKVGSDGSEWSVQFRDGWVVTCRLAEGSIVWPGLLMLKLSEPETARSFVLPLMRDAVSSAEWRRLSVLMRHQATGASA